MVSPGVRRKSAAIAVQHDVRPQWRRFPRPRIGTHSPPLNSVDTLAHELFASNILVPERACAEWMHSLARPVTLGEAAVSAVVLSVRPGSGQSLLPAELSEETGPFSRLTG